jgi:hypothetical protein
MVSLRLEPELLRDLRLFADEHDISISDVLRQAAVEFLNRTRRTPFMVTTTPMYLDESISVTWTQGSQTGTGLITASRKQPA